MPEEPSILLVKEAAAKFAGKRIIAVCGDSKIDETRIYSFQFLDWKRTYGLKKHWLAHTKKICLRCNLPIVKKQTGLKKR